MTSGLPTDACVEKADFLRRLCQYYGLDEMQLLNSDNSYDAREHNSSPSHSGAPSTKKTPEKTRYGVQFSLKCLIFHDLLDLLYFSICVLKS